MGSITLFGYCRGEGITFIGHRRGKASPLLGIAEVRALHSWHSQSPGLTNVAFPVAKASQHGIGGVAGIAVNGEALSI